MNSFTYTDNGCDEYIIEWTMHENSLSIEYNIFTQSELDGKELFANGFVKWDHCSNWHFPEFEKCMFHACTKDQLGIISTLLQLCWDHASKTMESFDQ